MEALNILNIDLATTVDAFKIGLKKDYLLYKDLVMTPCKMMDEVISRVLRFIRLAEDRNLEKNQDLECL